MQTYQEGMHNGLQCPNPTCTAQFLTQEDVLTHLNHPLLSCISCQNVKVDHPFSRPQFPPSPEKDYPSAYYQYHKTSSYTFGEAPNILQQIDSDQYAARRYTNCYYPFAGHDEWELAKFLVETMKQTDIDRFLKLNWVSTNH